MNYIENGELPMGLTLQDILNFNGRIDEFYTKYEDKIEKALDKYEQYLDRDYKVVLDKLTELTVNAEDSKLGCGLSFLSFLIPLVGFALYFKYKDTEIEKARQAARLAWISFILGIIVNIVSSLIY